MQMVFKGAKVAVLLALVVLAGCRTEPPDALRVSFGTYSATPVMVLAFTVNDHPAYMGFPTVQQSNADLVETRLISGNYSSGWPGDTDVARIEATWVEILTHRAYSAQFDVDTALLPRTPSLGVAVEVYMIFGPHGLLILAGDEVDSNSKPVDLSQICGTRQPALDEDFTGDPLAHAGMTGVLQIDYPPIAPETTCPEPDA